jgi:Cu2+-containing amine oxidase
VRCLEAALPRRALCRAQQGSSYGYPFAAHNSGTIHDHLLHWKVDADIAGTPNSIRMDRVVLQERHDSKG